LDDFLSKVKWWLPEWMAPVLNFPAMSVSPKILETFRKNIREGGPLKFVAGKVASGSTNSII